MSVVIRPRPTQRLSDLIRLLRDLADDPAQVRTGSGGVVVDEQLAYDYLTVALGKVPDLPPEPAPEPEAASVTTQEETGPPPAPRTIRPARKATKAAAGKASGGSK